MTRRLPEDSGRTGGYGAIGRLAVVMWAVLFSVLVVIAAGTFLGAAGGPPDPVGTDGETADGVDTAETDHAGGIVERYFPGVDFSAEFDRGSGLDFDLSTGSIDVGFAGIGGDDGRQTGSISHGAIDDGVARSSNAGLCAVGLAGPDAPVSLDVDAENDSVEADLVSEPVGRSGEDARESAAATIQSCRTGTGQSE